MAEQKQIELENLPSHLLECIFDYIPLIEIVKFCAVCPILLTIGNVVIRKRFFELRSGIYKELKVLREELDALPKTEVFFQNRIVLLRCYYFLEMLLSELSLIRAVWRKVLYNKSSSVVAIGKLLHEFYSAFYITKSRSLPPWHINDEIEGKVIKYAKLFFECKLDEVTCDEMFGCQILDVLDSMINRQFRINVKYYPQKNLCCIDAVYKLRDPHRFLHCCYHKMSTSKLLPISLWLCDLLTTYKVIVLNQEEVLSFGTLGRRTPKLNENGITEEDRRKILIYFISLVRINNRVALREEQYHREVEISRSREINLMALEIDFILHGSASWLTKDVRKYVSVFSNPHREERCVDEIFEFEETYSSSEFSHSTTMEKKFVCNIQINCPLNRAPLSIMDCWSRFKSDLLSQIYAKPHLSFLEECNNISNTSRESDATDILGDLRLQCTVEVVVSSNNNYEIDRLMINEPLSVSGSNSTSVSKKT